MARLPSTSRDQGFGSVESLIAVALVGALGVPLLTAVDQMVRTSTVIARAATVRSVLLETVRRVDAAVMACAYEPVALFEGDQVASGWTTDDVTVSVTASRPPGVSTWSDEPCVGDAPQPGSLQRVVIAVRDPRSGARQYVEVVKSDAP